MLASHTDCLKQKRLKEEERKKRKEENTKKSEIVQTVS